MNFDNIDFYLIFDLFILLLIGMGPKIALVPFLDLTRDLDADTQRKVARANGANWCRHSLDFGIPGMAADAAAAFYTRSRQYRWWNCTDAVSPAHAGQSRKGRSP